MTIWLFVFVFNPKYGVWDNGMSPEEIAEATAEQPDAYPNKLEWVMAKASCLAAVTHLNAEFLKNPSAHNWNPLLEAMARYQNVAINCTFD